MLLGLTVMAVIAALLIPPVPQALGYHHFADRRAM
jgi:hypothetical protein